MSYLQLDKGIDDFSKAVVSLWFRIPKSSIDAKLADPIPDILPFTIPLLTFGVPQVNRNYQGAAQLVSVYHFVPVDAFGNPVNTTVPPWGEFDFPTWSPAGDTPVDPSYIGLDIATDGTASLSFNLQTASYADVSGLQFNRQRVDIYQEGGGAIGDGWTQNLGRAMFTTLVDNTDALTGQQPEFFLVQSSLTITPDHWHHVLLSFDLDHAVVTHGPPHGVLDATTAAGTDSFCRFWYAIDDVNYNGDTNDLGPFFVTHGPDPNAILTQNGHHVADSVTGFPFNCAVAPASYSFDPSVIPSHGAELGVPASTTYLERIYPVEMAELQVFTGVTLDTSIEANRRAFITKDGTPADPLKKPNPPPPVPLPTGWVPPLKGPHEVLGKEADILLHGSGNWINGKNTGKVIKLNEIGKPSTVPAEPFVPTGSIVAYSPDPSLHGRQSPAPPPPH
jgi:hypothetical protein